MKSNLVYDFLKARFLIDENAIESWKFILFVIALTMVMIANIHWYEAKIFELAHLSEQTKALRTQYVDKKSELMQLKMESQLVNRMQERGLYQSDSPPQVIKINQSNQPAFWEKLWD